MRKTKKQKNHKKQQPNYEFCELCILFACSTKKTWQKSQRLLV